MGAATPSFEELFHDNHDQLVRLLTSLTGDREIASDCVQDAFIAAARRWRRVRTYDRPEAWVRRVAINRSRDMHRSDSRRRLREQRFSPSAPPCADDHAVRSEDQAGIVELLAALTPRQRSVAALTYVFDLPVSDVARNLGISSGTVKFHLSQARAALRTSIESQEPGVPACCKERTEAGR